MSTIIPSPCIQVCRMDDTLGMCTGCWRTLDEIATWSRLDNAEKSKILSHVTERRTKEGSENEQR